MMLNLLFASLGRIMPLALVAWVIRSRVLLGALGALAAAALYFGSYRGHVTAFGSGVAPVAAHAASIIASQLPGYSETELNPIVVFPFAGPKGAAMADLVRNALDASGRYDVIGKGVVEETLRYLNLDLPQLGEDDARHYGERFKAGAVVTGRMERVDELANPPVLVFSVSMRSTRGERRWTLDYPPIAAPPGGGTAVGAGRFGRFGDWAFPAAAFLVLALCTPFVLYPMTRRLLERESNFVNAAMILAFSALDVALLAILGFAGLSALVAVGAFVAASLLNYGSCSILERGRK